MIAIKDAHSNNKGNAYRSESKSRTEIKNDIDSRKEYVLTTVKITRFDVSPK